MTNDVRSTCGVSEPMTCIYCGASSGTKFCDTVSTAGDRFAVVKCAACPAWFLSPQPSEKQLLEAYDASYYGEGSGKFGGVTERILDYFRRRRANLVARYLPAGGRVLDVGCGNGRFLEALGGRGSYTLHGIEMPGRAAERAAQVKGISLKKGRLEAGDFAAGSLDAVTFFHVFEHLGNPRQTLDIVAGIVKPGGIAVFSFPNIGSLQARLFMGHWLHLDPPRHLSFFRPGDFTALMNERGFSPVLRRGFSIEYNPFGWQQSLLNVFLRKREVLFESKKGNRAYAGSYSRASLALQDAFHKITFPFFMLADAAESLPGRSGTVLLVFRKQPHLFETVTQQATPAHIW